MPEYFDANLGVARDNPPHAHDDAWFVCAARSGSAPGTLLEKPNRLLETIIGRQARVALG